MNYQDKAIADVKQYMQTIAAHSYGDTKVGQVLNDALDTNGKMIRARMLLLSAEFGSKFKEKDDKLKMLAAMVELTHLASLIHDDIIDESDFRRGKPSIQSKYSKDAAVYAGDFLMSRIYYYEAKEKMNGSAALLSKAIESMCTGEIGQAVCRYKEGTSIEQYLENIKGKTAALFRTACEIGATEAGASKTVICTLTEIGENLGYMFQLRDDLLDFTADKYHLGKEAHKDFSEGIYTMPVLAALKNDRDGKLLALVQKNLKEHLSEKDIMQAEKLVAELGGVDYTRNAISKCADRIRQLSEKLPENKAKNLLRQLVKNLEEK